MKRPNSGEFKVKRYLSCLVPVAILLAVSGGCGGGPSLNLAKATGTVTYNGQPLEGASVQFHSNLEKENQSAAGITDKDGKFTLTTAGRAGAPLGVCTVTVTKMSSIAKGMDLTKIRKEDMQKMQMQQQGTTAEAAKSLIPERYGNPAESKLTATVDKDGSKNDFSFPLVD